MRYLLLVMFALVGWACSEDLDTGAPEPAPEPSEGVIDNGDGTWSLVVDATDDAAWVFVDLADGGLVGEGDGWELSFQRFHVGVNGGAGGDGRGAAQWLAGGMLDVTAAPEDGWLQDTPDGDDEDDLVDRVFADWYDYDQATHQLSPKAGVWFVRASDAEAHYAVRIDAYYDAVGTAAMVQITWKVVEGPMVISEPEPQPEPEAQPEPQPEMEPEVMLPPDAVEVPAQNGMAPVFLAIGDSIEVVEAGQPWDIGFLGVFVLTNSGTSGEGLAGARRTELAYDAITEAPTVGYAVDTTVPLPGPPGSGEASGSPVFNDTEDGWYDYNPMTHQVAPKEQAWLLRTHDGDYARFEILTYGSGTYTLRASKVAVAPEANTIDIAAPDGWAYLSLRTGMSVEVDDPATDPSWDLGVYGVRIRTNSGDSGGGMGGAYSAEAPAEGDAARCVADAMVPEPGPPGSGEFAGSPTLGAWYDYNPMTHAVTPMDTDWVVCTADGGLARLRITAYADDRFSFEWTYAGAGRTDF